MVSLSGYSLYWHSPLADAAAHEGGQYVFTSKLPVAVNLRRVRSVPDLLQAAADSGLPMEKMTVAVISLLAGNLLARQQWLSLFILGAAFTLTANCESWIGLATVMGMLLCRFFETLALRHFSFHWLVVVAVVMFLSVAITSAIMWAVREDARSYALVQDSAEGDEVVIRNCCCMDVKVLLFHSTDTVRLIPHGGLLLGGVLLERNAEIALGRPDCTVKVYAPWEKELGIFSVTKGRYSLRATASPFHLYDSSDDEGPMVSNSSLDTVRVCVCPLGCWTQSLWLPMASIFARLRWGSFPLAPGDQEHVRPPCVLRVYSQRGQWCGALLQQDGCLLGAGESVEYCGSIRWTSSASSGAFQRSASSMFHAVH